MVKKRILITGALGQLGSAIIKTFDDSWDVIATDFIKGEIEGFHGTFLQLDISDPKEVSEVVNKTKPDIVLNLAAMTDVDGCENDPEKAIQINETGVQNLLNAFSGTFVQISTDYIFDGKNGPYTEDHPISPINVYGETKLNAEEIIRVSNNPWLIVRTNVLFDYTKNTSASFVKWVVDSLREQKQINIVNDQWGNPTWTMGLADCIQQLLKKRITGLFNYSGKDYLNRLDFAVKIAEVFNLDPSLISAISTGALKQKAERPLKSGLLTDKIEKVLNLEMISTEESLKKIRENLNL